MGGYLETQPGRQLAGPGRVGVPNVTVELITSSTPQLSHGQELGNLPRNGTVVPARVIAMIDSATARLSIMGQTIDVNAPQTFQAGTNISVAVLRDGANLKLVLQPDAQAAPQQAAGTSTPAHQADTTGSLPAAARAAIVGALLGSTSSLQAPSAVGNPAPAQTQPAPAPAAPTPAAPAAQAVQTGPAGNAQPQAGVQAQYGLAAIADAPGSPGTSQPVTPPVTSGAQAEALQAAALPGTAVTPAAQNSPQAFQVPSQLPRDASPGENGPPAQTQPATVPASPAAPAAPAGNAQPQAGVQAQYGPDAMPQAPASPANPQQATPPVASSAQAAHQAAALPATAATLAVQIAQAILVPLQLPRDASPAENGSPAQTQPATVPASPAAPAVPAAPAAPAGNAQPQAGVQAQHGLASMPQAPASPANPQQATPAVASSAQAAHQAAALPGSAPTPAVQNTAQAILVPFQLPQMAQPIMLKVQQEEEDGADGSRGQAAKRMWTVNVSLDAGSLGLVNIGIGLRQDSVSVRLSAGTLRGAAHLSAWLPELRKSLEQANFVPGELSALVRPEEVQTGDTGPSQSYTI